MAWTTKGQVKQTGTRGPVGAFDPDDRDAYNRLTTLLGSFGLSSLAPKILAYVQEGMGDDSIMLELQNTKEWKARFAANDKRKAAGMTVLTPAEYLATERSYMQILAEAGVPKGFYDTTTDFTDFLSKDISPAELKGRVDTAATFVRAADPAQRAAFKKFYTDGDMIAYALDPQRAAPLVGRAFQAASLAGIANGNGLGLGKTAAERLADNGVTGDNAREGLAQLGQNKGSLDLLAQVSGETTLTGDELATAAFLGDAKTTKKVDRLKSAERGRFGGSSGIGQGSLSKSSSGL